MNPKVSAALAAMAPIFESLLEEGAAAAGGPIAGAAATAVVGAVNASGLIPPAPVAAPAPAAGPIVGEVPANAGGIAPPVADPSAHPVLARAGQAPLVPQPTLAGTLPDTSDMNFPDVYTRLAALEQKVNALVVASGLQGSAAMAAHP